MQAGFLYDAADEHACDAVRGAPDFRPFGHRLFSWSGTGPSNTSRRPTPAPIFAAR
jgi:hypothetical protein